MKIYKQINFKGGRCEAFVNLLIDTGAGISFIPIDLARSMGTWCTDQYMEVVGVHGQ